MLPKPHGVSLLVAVVFLWAIGCVDPITVVIEPLRVVNWSPGNGAACIDVATTVQAVFSDDLDIASLEAGFHLRDSDANSVEAEIAYIDTARTATLTPAIPLNFGTVYTAVAGEEILGLERGRLSVEQAVSFATIGSHGCGSEVECARASECPGAQVCSLTGLCVDDCLVPGDCPSGVCQAGVCMPGGDPGPAPGD